MGRQGKKICLNCISETIRCKKLILFRDWWGIVVQCHSVILILPCRSDFDL